MPPIAFDSGPGNVFIDEAMRILFGRAMDVDGSVARQGTVDPTLLAELLANDFYKQPPPKSTGRELFSADVCRALVAAAQARGVGANDIVATFTELTAVTLVDALRRFGAAATPIQQLLIAGGGARCECAVWMANAVS